MNEYLTKSVDFFLDGGLFMYPLALCALLAGAAFVYKCLTLRRRAIAPRSLEQVISDVSAGRVSLDELSPRLWEGDSLLARLVACVAENRNRPAEQIREILQARARDEFVRLQSGIPLLDTVINIAPMFGILGTASGLVVVFSSFGEASNQAAISVGIARALNTTIAGLAIAAPSVVAHMYFSRRLEKLSAAMESLLADVVDAVAHQRS